AAFGEGEEDGLGEDQAAGGFEVAFHAAGIDVEAAHDGLELGQHVVHQGEGAGEDEPLGGGVGDVALVPEGDVFHAGEGEAAHHAGQAADALALVGVALVGHGRGALLGGPERLFDLAHLGAGQVADFGGELVEGGGDQGQGVEGGGV